MSSSPFPQFWNIMRRLAREYRVWVGDHGYDTRPYALLGQSKVYAPVAYTEEYATRGRKPAHVPHGDVWAWLVSLPAGTLVVFPEYSGMHWRGDTCFDSEGRTTFYLDPEDAA